MNKLTNGDMDIPDADLEPEEDYEVTAVFEAQFPGHCAVNWDHRIKPGERVGRLQHSDNPMVPVRGVACKNCIRDLPREGRG